MIEYIILKKFLDYSGEPGGDMRPTIHPVFNPVNCCNTTCTTEIILPPYKPDKLEAKPVDFPEFPDFPK